MFMGMCNTSSLTFFPLSFKFITRTQHGGLDEHGGVMDQVGEMWLLGQGERQCEMKNAGQNVFRGRFSQPFHFI
jgi:hypothetical protein